MINFQGAQPGGTTLARPGCSAEVRKMDPTWNSFFAKKDTLSGTKIPKFCQKFLIFNWFKEINFYSSLLMDLISILLSKNEIKVLHCPLYKELWVKHIDTLHTWLSFSAINKNKSFFQDNVKRMRKGEVGSQGQTCSSKFPHIHTEIAVSSTFLVNGKK